jgi:hypothetical protein
MSYVATMKPYAFAKLDREASAMERSGNRDPQGTPPSGHQPAPDTTGLRQAVRRHLSSFMTWHSPYRAARVLARWQKHTPSNGCA